MMKFEDDNRLEEVESLLREHGPTELSPDFRSSIMSQIERLPDPELLPPPAAQRDWHWFLSLMSRQQRAGILAAFCLMLALYTPAAQEWIADINFSLAATTVSLNMGEVAISTGIGTLLAAGLGALMMAGVGIYSSRNHLISI